MSETRLSSLAMISIEQQLAETLNYANMIKEQYQSNYNNKNTLFIPLFCSILIMLQNALK